MPGILERWRTLFRPTVYNVSFGPDAPSQVLNLTARQLYNTQDNLAAVVNFLANSVAQLPIKVYKRGNGDDRQRDRDSVAAKLLYQPNSDQTEFEFIRGLITEYMVFGCVYTWLLPDSDSQSGWQMRIIPTDWVQTTEKTNSYGPERIVVTSTTGNSIEIPRSEFIRFCTYSPGNPGGYVSPISALRQTLEEQIQAGRFRRELWKSSGRLNAQIIRPKDVQPWTEETKKKWVEAFREAWGAGGSKAGSIPLMEDGMEIKPFSTSFKEQQWVESVKLSRESVAAAYRINPSLVWHTDSQTYASSKDNARALYAECLGPDLQMIQQRINAFLLPMIGADPGTYVEFDLTEKLKGNFEERASILQSSVGGPWLTRNEARRDNNLPPIEGGDELIVPMNVVAGGQASPTDTHMNQYAAAVPCKCGKHLKAAEEEEDVEIVTGAKVSQKEQDEVGELLEKFFKRQQKSIAPKIGADAEWWNADRWNKELADDLEPVLDGIADRHGAAVAKAIGTEYVTEQTTAYLRAMAEGRADAINGETRKKLQQVMDDAEEDEDLNEAVNHEFEKRSGVDAMMLGTMLAKTVAGWSAEEADRQAKDQGSRKQVYKEWITGPNARASHQLMDGERVPIDEPFSNGADWPGDDTLDPEESCGCNCSTRVIIITE
jgi:HK97 family phage portal protein